MKRRVAAAFLIPIAIVAGAAAVQAPQGKTTAAVPNDSSLLAARELAWRDYFSAGKNLPLMLPPDFVAIHAGDTGATDRANTLEGSKRAGASDQKLVRLQFPKNIIQRHGNVAVIHSRYEGLLRSSKGAETMKGWITETFYWDGARWMHPSWHMSDDPARKP